MVLTSGVARDQQEGELGGIRFGLGAGVLLKS